MSGFRAVSEECCQSFDRFIPGAAARGSDRGSGRRRRRQIPLAKHRRGPATRPGVTLDRTADGSSTTRGEALHINVRGLPPQFEVVQLNGRNIAVNEAVENGGKDGRQFRFDYGELGNEYDPSISGMASWTNGTETFGALLAGGYTTRHARQDRVYEQDAWLAGRDSKLQGIWR